MSACYLSVIMMLSQQSCLQYSPNQFETHTILHCTRARRLITPSQILLRPGRQIRRWPTLTLNNWDYPASPSDVTLRRNTLETSENAYRLTSRQRIIQLKRRAVCLNTCLKGQLDILANSVFPPLKLTENTNKRVGWEFFLCSDSETFALVFKNTT